MFNTENMEQYSIYCTEEQTKKAFTLGASLKEHPFEASIIEANKRMFSNLVCINDRYYCLPTAEQMIGWLEEQKTIRSVEIVNSFVWKYRVKTIEDDTNEWIIGVKHSRKEATLSAIDSALEYLNKK